MTRHADAAGLGLTDETFARPRPRHAVVQAAACYFMVTLTLGWLLGPVRDFWVRAGADPLFAILCQAVATLLALVWASGWVVSAFDVPDRTGARLTVGFAAIGALFTCDVVAGYLMFGMTPLDFAVHFLSPAGVTVGGSFLFAAILPALRNRGGSVR